MEQTRNIGIAAHIDAGKTTTTERILFYTGLIRRMGEVHDGNTVTDWMEQERERGITITAAAITCFWTQRRDGTLKSFEGVPFKVNIIDTPGHVDFTAEVERSMRVLDGAVAVFCGVAGVQPQSETVWRQATKYNVPRIAFVNKMDRIGANFDGAVEEMRCKLGAYAYPVIIPIGSEDHLNGVIDVVSQKAIVYDDSDPLGVEYSVVALTEDQEIRAQSARDQLIAAVADKDEAIAELVIEDRPIEPSALKAAIRRLTCGLELVPVIGGSAFKKKGIQPLMDAIIDYLPSPLDIPPMKGHPASRLRDSVEIASDDGQEFCGLAFKLWTDSFVGKLVFFRVYRGLLKKGSAVLNARTGRRERINRLLLIQAEKRIDVETIYSGDIAAIVGVRNVATGHTLCSQKTPILLEPPTFPEPVISMAIEPRTTADREKLSAGLRRLTDEDPTFKCYTNDETGQQIISGMGELHLEIIRSRLLKESKVDANTGAPQIAYRETVTQSAKGEGKFIRQSGGKGQYGHVEIVMEPNRAGRGLEIENKIIGGVIPKEFLPAVVAGLKESASGGVLAGYPMVDLKLSIVGGSSHEVDSSELAFKMAAIFAFKNASKSASVILLEPVMNVEVNVPEEYQGDILGDFNRRRGRILSIDSKPRIAILHAEVPLAEMFGYSTAVRSLSKGRASYSMEPVKFEQVPASVLSSILDTGDNLPLGDSFQS